MWRKHVNHVNKRRVNYHWYYVWMIVNRNCRRRIHRTENWKFIKKEIWDVFSLFNEPKWIVKRKLIEKNVLFFNSTDYSSKSWILSAIYMFAIRSQHETNILFILREIREIWKRHLFQTYRHERFDIFDVKTW